MPETYETREEAHARIQGICRKRGWGCHEMEIPNHETAYLQIVAAQCTIALIPMDALQTEVMTAILDVLEAPDAGP